MSNTHYRQYYKDYYRLEFDSRFDIHHIDRDKTHNDISNLILLPKSVHLSYHYYLSACDNISLESFMFYKLDAEKDLTAIYEFLDIYKKIKQWVDFKQYLDSMFYYRMDSWEKIIIVGDGDTYGYKKIP